VVFDVVHESAETLLPPLGHGVPCPTAQVFQSTLAISLQGAFDVVIALFADPCAELVAIDGVPLWDAGVTVAFDVVHESAEARLPLLGERIPCPAGQVFQSTLAISLQGAFAVVIALLADPCAELVAIDGVVVRDAGVTVSFDVALELAEDCLPPLGMGFPCPAGQVFESMFAVGVKFASVMEAALGGDPVAKLVVIGCVGLRDAGITVAFDKLFQQPEPELPVFTVWLQSGSAGNFASGSGSTPGW
jgi:hypothetical protein